MARGTLNRDRIIDAAVRIADSRGLASLSMRNLAAELDVEAMSLYNHVANKDDILQGLANRVWSEVDLARDESDWRAALHRLCGSSFRAMTTHSWFLSLPVLYGGMGRLYVIDATLAHIKAAGVSLEVAFHALHTLDGYVAGYAWQANAYANMEAMKERAEEVLAQLDTETFPHLMEHVRQHVDHTPPGDGFVIGLDMLLDGLARQRA